MERDPRELDVPLDALADQEAKEVIRIWTGATEYVSITGGLYKDPGLWGFLFCQLSRHIARSYELNNFANHDEVLAAIRERFIETWDDLGDDTTGELVDD